MSARRRVRAVQTRAGTLLASLWLLACHTGGWSRGVPGPYAQSLDSASSACRAYPALCGQVAGEETVLPGAGQRLAEFGTRVGTLGMVWSAEQKARVEQVLSECANEARERVLLERMEGRSPTAAECDEEKSFGGKVRTRARFLGEEMHRAAVQCAQAKLSVLRPGGFSLEPRYRYDRQTKRLELISAEQERAWIEEGCFDDLKGTIKPAVVIHSGDPIRPNAVYDFKFPCKNADRGPPWCVYYKGPHAGFRQDEVYKDALGAKPMKVVPYLGVVP